MAIDTRRVKEHFRLRFDNLDDMLTYADSLVAGGTRQLGNWSLGQNLQHLALTQNASIDGFSKLFPYPVRILLRVFFKKWMLHNRLLPSGPKIKTLTLPDEIDAQEALANLHAATHRVKTETKRSPNPGFGEMSLSEWNLLYLRHAELHLGYCVPLNQTKSEQVKNEPTSRDK